MRLLSAVCVVLLAAPLWAQAPEPIVARDVAVFAAGVNPTTGTPVTGTLATVPNSGWTCGLSKTAATGTQTNPTELWIDDPVNPATLDCKLSAAASATLFNSVPLGTGFRAAVKARGATTASAWSVVSNPFDHVAVAPAPATGVRVQ